MGYFRVMLLAALAPWLAGVSAAQPSAASAQGEERSAPPPPDLSTPEDAASPIRAIQAWHAGLSRHIPSALAWGILGAPLLLPPLVWLVWRRRARGDQRSSGQRGELLRLVTIPDPTAPSAPQAQAPHALAHLLETPLPCTTPTAAEPTSLHEVYVALGARPDLLSPFLGELSARFDASGWIALLKTSTSEPLSGICSLWIKTVARERISSWLAEHPALAEDGLVVHLPHELDAAALDAISILRADGLAVEPDGLQAELLRQLRRGLTLAYRGGDNPFVLETVARKAALPAIHQGVDDTVELRSHYPLAVLLFGLPAHRKAVAAGLSVGTDDELTHHLAEHRRRQNAPSEAEGTAFHLLLQGGSLSPGMGMALASIAGGSFSPASVVLHLSKAIKDLSSGAAKALEALGIEGALALRERPALGELLLANLKRSLGSETLEEALQSATNALREFEKTGTREAFISGLRQHQAPDFSLLRHHRQRVAEKLEQLPQAVFRTQQLWAKLSYAGSTAHDRTIAARRLGYFLAGLGPEFFRGAPRELLRLAAGASDQLRSGR